MSLTAIVTVLDHQEIQQTHFTVHIVARILSLADDGVHENEGKGDQEAVKESDLVTVQNQSINPKTH